MKVSKKYIYFRGKISFQFSDTAAPIIGSFFGYQFDVQKATLLGSIMMTRRSTFNNARRYIGDKIL